MRRPRYFILSYSSVVLGGAAVIAANGLPLANAQMLGSVYSSTATKQSRIMGTPSGAHDSTVRICPSNAGRRVLVSEDDLGETVSVRHDVLQPPENQLRKPGSIRPPPRSKAHAERQAICDHPALAP